MLNAARSSRVSFFASSAAAVLVALSFAACDSEVDTEDGECCLMDPQCPSGTEEVDSCSTSECITVEACCTEKLCEPVVNCTAEPTCQPGETEVATCEGSTAFECHAVEECGQTTFCETPPPCTALPS